MSVSLKRCVFAAGCFGALTVSAIYPAWGAIQQSETYGGYVDMALQSLGLPSNVIAGDEVTMPVRISNLGPETAEFPQVVFSADSSMQLVATTGCGDSPQPLTRCHLDAPMAAGESRDVNFIGRLDPSARGMLTLGAFAMSEAIDVQPSNEMVIRVQNIAAFVDLQARALSEQPIVDASGQLIWELEVTNSGISDALLPAISVYTYPSFSAIDCAAAGPLARCPGNGAGALIGMGSSLRFTVSMPGLSPQVRFVDVTLGAQAHQDETELNYNDNHATVRFTDALFSGDFEF